MTHTHTHAPTQSVTQTHNMLVHFVCQDISPRHTSSFSCWILVMYLWAGKLVWTPDQVGDVHRLIDGQTKLREELWNDVDRVRNELRMETASRKEDLNNTKDRKQIKTGEEGHKFYEMNGKQVYSKRWLSQNIALVWTSKADRCTEKRVTSSHTCARVYTTVWHIYTAQELAIKWT